MKWHPLNSLLVFAIALMLWTESASSVEKEAKRKIQKKFQNPNKSQKQKELISLAKKLEYDVTLKEGENSLDFGLSPIDLNLLADEEFAADVVEGVEDELSAVDQEFPDQQSGDVGSNKTFAGVTSAGPISLMHQGMYSPSPEYNALIDGLIENVKKDLEKREMDPLYFGIHNKGVVRHSQVGSNPSLSEQFLGSARPSQPENENSYPELPIGVGVIKGLKKLKRFGNAESRKDGSITLVRIHCLFGPLNIHMIFGSQRGIRFLNTTLSALAGHALFQVSNQDESVILKEFIIDSPMPYEIRLRGSKNRRFRSLSQSSISRMFRRGGRMETRLGRSFHRGAQKPIRDASQKNNKNKQDNRNGRREKLETARKP